jgi:hypothetical protein
VGQKIFESWFVLVLVSWMRSLGLMSPQNSRTRPIYAAVARPKPVPGRVKVRDGGSRVLWNMFIHSPDMSRRRYRCGDAGHMAVGCWNALTSFKCGRLGHILSFCRNITLILLHLLLRCFFCFSTSDFSFFSPLADPMFVPPPGF